MRPAIAAATAAPVPSAEDVLRVALRASVRPTLRAGVLAAALAVALVAPREAVAQAPSVTEDLAADLAEAGGKLVALARAVPASEWEWRPGPGVRSVEEVVRHVAYDAFYFPTAVGIAPPVETGITEDYATARAWGARPASRDASLASLEAALDHLRGAVLAGGDATLHEPTSIFGRSMDRQELWLLATVHLHEHLGQLIAYARTRGVAPPWSAGPD